MCIRDRESSKSRLIEFGRFAEQNRRARGECKPETFDFLGFTFYWHLGKEIPQKAHQLAIEPVDEIIHDRGRYKVPDKQ